MSVGKDVVMSHIARAIGDNIGTDEKVSIIDATAAVFKLGRLSPIVDTVTGEALGYEWKIVVKKHAKAVKPGESA